MSEESAVIDTGAIYAKLNSQIEELKTLISGSQAVASDVPQPQVKNKKKRAKPNLTLEQIEVLKQRLVKAREAKKSKRLASASSSA